MSNNKTVGLVCQSCGMPLAKAEDFGTLAPGTPSNDYCHFCFVNGQFTNPDLTLDEMTDFCSAVLVKRGMPSSEARNLMTRMLPSLKRWKRSPVGV